MQKRAKPKTLKIVAGSVRAQILKFLRNGQQRKFKDIKNEVRHHEYVVKRELDILIKYNLVKREGTGKNTRYALNKTNKNKKEIEKVYRTLDITPEPNCKIYPVKTDLNNIIQKIKEKPSENFNLQFADGTAIKKEIQSTLPHIEITIAGEKNEDFEKPAQSLGKNINVLSALAFMMNSISMSRMAESQKVDKPFQVTISWKPTTPKCFLCENEGEINKNLSECPIYETHEIIEEDDTIKEVENFATTELICKTCMKKLIEGELVMLCP